MAHHGLFSQKSRVQSCRKHTSRLRGGAKSHSNLIRTVAFAEEDEHALRCLYVLLQRANLMQVVNIKEDLAAGQHELKLALNHSDLILSCSPQGACCPAFVQVVRAERAECRCPLRYKEAWVSELALSQVALPVMGPRGTQGAHNVQPGFGRTTRCAFGLKMATHPFDGGPSQTEDAG